MAKRDKIQVDLIKLTSGERLLHLTDLLSGLALEKKNDPTLPVLRQKQRLFSVFEATLVQAELTGV